MVWEFFLIRGTFWGAPITRILVFWGLCWGPFILGNYHLGVSHDNPSHSLTRTHNPPQSLHAPRVSRPCFLRNVRLNEKPSRLRILGDVAGLRKRVVVIASTGKATIPPTTYSPNNGIPTMGTRQKRIYISEAPTSHFE